MNLWCQLMFKFENHLRKKHRGNIQRVKVMSSNYASKRNFTLNGKLKIPAMYSPAFTAIARKKSLMSSSSAWFERNHSPRQTGSLAGELVKQSQTLRCHSNKRIRTKREILLIWFLLLFFLHNTGEKKWLKDSGWVSGAKTRWKLTKRNLKRCSKNLRRIVILSGRITNRKYQY